MHHSTAHLIQRLGVTREMLRYYEKAGLISPRRDPQNDYREYSDLDGFEILRIKTLQSYRLPLKSVRTSLDSSSLDNQAQLLGQLEGQLQAHIDRLQRQLLRLKKHRSFIEDAMHAADGVAEMETYGIYQLMMLGQGVTASAGAARIAAQWIESTPITEIGWSAPWPREGLTHVPTQIGLMAMPHCVREQSLCTDPPVLFFPPGHSIRIMLCTEDPFSISAAALAPLKDYALRQGYRIVSDISGRYSGSALENGRRMFYFSARVLVLPEKSA